MKMASKKEDYLKNEDDLKNSDNLKNEDDLKIKTTSKIMSGGGLSFQAMFAAPNTSKSCIWHSSIAIWNYSGSVWVGSGRLGPIVIITLSQPASRAGALAWLSLAKSDCSWMMIYSVLYMTRPHKTCTRSLGV